MNLTFRHCVFAALLAMTSAPLAVSAETVELESGVYHSAVPANWDGKTKLPLVVFLHMYRQTGADVVDNRYIAEAVTGLGAVLVAPDGLNGGWSFHGSPQRRRDDVAFIRSVIEDAHRRWPIDDGHVVAAGFSVGGSMVWELACHAATGFTAFLPMAGSFWLPYPESCETGPVDLRHVHGLNDHTVPMAGRAIGGTWHQGDTWQSFEILKRLDQCPVEPTRTGQEAELECRHWTGCASGRELELCLHQGDHELSGQWLRDGLVWAFGLAR